MESPKYTPYGSPPKSPYGSLPKSPRANREMLSPIDTSFHFISTTPSAVSAKSFLSTMPPAYLDAKTRNADSHIFVNATIPSSPASSTSSDFTKGEFGGLAPRKRSGFARLFCCLGREERARRRSERKNTAYVKAGEPVHWTEL